MGCVECFEGLYVDLHPTHTAFCRRTRTALARRNARDTVVAEEDGMVVREVRQAGWDGGLGGMAGRVGWLAGWRGGPGGMAGRVGWLARCSEGDGSSE